MSVFNRVTHGSSSVFVGTGEVLATSNGQDYDADFKNIINVEDGRDKGDVATMSQILERRDGFYDAKFDKISNVQPGIKPNDVAVVSQLSTANAENALLIDNLAEPTPIPKAVFQNKFFNFEPPLPSQSIFLVAREEIADLSFENDFNLGSNQYFTIEGWFKSSDTDATNRNIYVENLETEFGPYTEIPLTRGLYFTSNIEKITSTQGLSVDFWLKIPKDSPGDKVRGVFDLRGSNNVDTSSSSTEWQSAKFNLEYQTDTRTFHVSAGGVTKISPSVDVSNWTHVCYAWDNENFDLNLYINGKLLVTHTFPARTEFFINKNVYCYIGQMIRNSEFNYPLANGGIHDFRIFNKVIQPGNELDILHNTRVLDSNTDGLVAQWDWTGSTFPLKSTVGNNGDIFPSDETKQIIKPLLHPKTRGLLTLTAENTITPLTILYKHAFRQLTYNYSGFKITLENVDLTSWRHLAITIGFAGSGVTKHTIYLDGKQVVQELHNSVHQYFNGSQALFNTIGSMQILGKKYYWAGNLRNIRFWNVELSENQVTDAYKTTQVPKNDVFSLDDKVLIQWDFNNFKNGQFDATIAQNNKLNPLKLNRDAWDLSFGYRIDPLVLNNLKLLQGGIPLPILTPDNLKPYVQNIQSEVDSGQTSKLESHDSQLELQSRAISQLQDFTGYLLAYIQDIRQTFTIEYENPSVTRISEYGYIIRWGDSRQVSGVEVILVDNNGTFIKTIMAEIGNDKNSPYFLQFNLKEYEGRPTKWILDFTDNSSLTIDYTVANFWQLYGLENSYDVL